MEVDLNQIGNADEQTVPSGLRYARGKQMSHMIRVKFKGGWAHPEIVGGRLEFSDDVVVDAARRTVAPVGHPVRVVALAHQVGGQDELEKLWRPTKKKEKTNQRRFIGNPSQSCCSFTHRLSSLVASLVRDGDRLGPNRTVSS